MDERQYLLEAINKDLALIKKIEDRLRCEDNPRRQLQLETDSEETWQKIRERKAHLSSLEQEELKKTVSYLQLSPLKLDPLPLPERPIRDEDSSLNSEPRLSEERPVVKPQDKKPGADYSKLRELLEAGKWKEADLETARVILEVTNRKKEGWLRAKDIENFPCSDLSVINNLWVTVSKGRFGFSVQREIWLNFGGKPGEFDANYFLEFGNRVGWRINDKWLNYNDLYFSLDAPRGHLPSLQLTGLKNDPGWLSLWKNNFKGFLLPIETCFLKDNKTL
ncbi:GUN4 domain-containing protein [Moorena sp. SIO3I6]|uniref:GUN4 domain-containing protein n=1 Tax=Moorena sp. SIO3I6 TaxID=2607831 RepID=UPI0013FAB0EA|nr:GUN4 domain-containing protein [Moorena sp. SIO3I6]NEP24972.1 GUN4 domain-containing protein [Moorena sp. SIO3I6]